MTETAITMIRSFKFIVIIIVALLHCSDAYRGDYIGCFRNSIGNGTELHLAESVDTCLFICEELFYKYSILSNGNTCNCANTPGQFQLSADSCSLFCVKNDTRPCGGSDSVSVYDTGVMSPGPPGSIDVINATETTIRVQWTPPDAYSLITAYIVRARVLETYADVTLLPIEWSVSNATLKYELVNLHPGTLYEICVVAVNSQHEGPNVTAKVETVIGIPEPSPPDVIDKGQHGNKMVVHIPEARNVNGPISMYRIVVSIELYQQGYILENLGNFTAAVAKDLPYYITAELDPVDIKNDFIIGDERTYNGFYNAPLPLTKDIEVSLGIVSEKNHVKRIRYAESTKKIILNINELEEVSPLVVAFGAGIAIGVVLLLIGIGLIIILRKKRIQFAGMERSSQTMPLSMSEPCVEIENAGFLQEEEEKVDYYGDLKRKLWNIPRDLIDIDIACVVGLGSYGKCTRGQVQQHRGHSPGLVQIIADRELEKADRRLMLQELDLLIKSSEHENVVALIGICETSATLFVVLEDLKQTLKDMLLQSRCRDIQNNKFSLLSERKVVDLCTDIARGMDYLHNKKIMHKRLCCRNVLVNEQGVAKVAGFGLSHIRPLHQVPDYTRWTSCELLKQTRCNPKADVWSYGCLLWETFTLGATLYPQTPSKDVSTRVLRGMRPSQPSYVGDALFQLCLQCWQVDPDERPVFAVMLHELSQLAGSLASLSFTYYNGYDYEPYVPHYEVIS